MCAVTDRLTSLPNPTSPIARPKSTSSSRRDALLCVDVGGTRHVVLFADILVLAIVGSGVRNTQNIHTWHNKQDAGEETHPLLPFFEGGGGGRLARARNRFSLSRNSGNSSDGVGCNCLPVGGNLAGKSAQRGIGCHFVQVVVVGAVWLVWLNFRSILCANWVMHATMGLGLGFMVDYRDVLRKGLKTGI